MVKKSRIALIAIVVALGFASPAMAQSTHRDFGAGNEMSSHFQAKQPAWTKSDSGDTAAATGGADAGYNWQNAVDGSEETNS